MIAVGNEFQTFAAAIGNARSPIVLCNERGTCSVDVEPERSHLRDVGNWMELTGQVLWRRTVQTAIRKNGKTDVKEPITIRCDGDNISLTMCVTFSVLSDHRLMTPQGVLDQTQPTSHDY